MSRRFWILVAVVLASAVVFLDSTIVNVALPQIARDLDSSFFTDLEAQAYVYYGYLLTLSALLILAGALSDFYGRKRLFVLGLAGFGVTSVMCGAAPTMELLIGARILQGAAGAVLVPGSLAIISNAFTGEEQGRAFGIWAGASAATSILGPAIGGFLVSTISWRAAFLMNIPLVALALWASRYIDESRDEEASSHFDWFGAVVVALAIGGLTYGAIRGQAQQWGDASAFAALAIGAVAIVAFPFLMARSRHPLVPLEMFKNRNFSITNISTMLIYGALYVTFQYFALFAIGTLQYNELAFGLASIPGSLFLALFSSRFGSLAVRYGPRIFMTIGPVLMGLALLWLARVPATSDGWQVESGDPSSWVPPNGYLVDVLPGLVLFGIGIMIMVAPLTTALMRSVPGHRSGLASAINNAISRVGPQLAGALLFIAISSSFYASLADSLPAETIASARFREQVSPLNRPDESVGPEVAARVDEASAEAFHLAMFVSAGLCFVGAVANGLGIRNEQLHGGDSAAA